MALEQTFQRQERRMKALQLLRELQQNDPRFLAEIVADLTSNGSARVARPPVPKSSAAAAGATTVDKVVAVSKSRPGEWIDTTDIKTVTGLSKAQLRYVLVSGPSSDRFERRSHPEHGKKLQWRLKQ